MSAAIEIRGLTRRFGGVTAVDSLDLNLAEGAALLLIGANGAGKSTTLHTLLGLTLPSAGESRIFGKPSAALTPEDFRQIGYASDGQRAPAHLKLETWMSDLRPRYPTWDRELEAYLAHRFHLPIQRPLGRLSRGERMKALLLAALSFRPRLLVLDEPLSGLDPASRAEVVEALVDQAADCTLLIASHDLGELEPLATHVALMRAGRLSFMEETDQLLARFRQVSALAPNPVGPSPTWLDLRQDGERISFIDSAFTTEEALSRSLGGARPQLAPMSLAAIAAAVMRHQPSQGAAT